MNYLKLWGRFLSRIGGVLRKPFHPKFLIIAITTLAISTSGIWVIPLYFEEQNQLGFSFFSYIITTLGVLAAENFIREKNKTQQLWMNTYSILLLL